MDIQGILAEDTTALDKTSGGFDPLSFNDVNSDPLITSPSKNTPQTVTAVTHVDSTQSSEEDRAIDRTTPEDFFGSNIEVGEVPDVHAKITLIDDTATALENLNIIKSTLICRKGVCRADAIAIESTAPNSITTQFSFEEFSLATSKTNFVETNTTVDDLIQSKTKEIVSLYDVVFKEAEDELDDFLENYSEKYLPYVKDQLTTIDDAFSNVIATFISKPSILVYDSEDGSVDIPKVDYYSGEETNGSIMDKFQDVKTIPLMVPNTILDRLSDTEDYKQGLMLFRSILSRPHFMHFVASILGRAKKTYHGINEVTASGVAFSSTTNLDELISFYQRKQDIIATLEEMGIELAGSVETLTSLCEKAKEITDPVELTKFTTHHLKELLHASTNHIYVKEVVETFILMNTAVFHIRNVLTVLTK